MTRRTRARRTAPRRSEALDRMVVSEFNCPHCSGSLLHIEMLPAWDLPNGVPPTMRCCHCDRAVGEVFATPV